MTPFKRAYHWLKPVVLSRYLWLGSLALLTACFLAYLAADHLIMPAYTRHNVTVTVPDTRNLDFAEAERILHQADLRVKTVVERFLPNLPRNIVLAQDPPPSVKVKPGRQIYLTVNSGRQMMVAVPNLKDLSLRQAKHRIAASRLTLGAVQRDTLPSPYQNIITRQSPEPGDSLAPGTAVALWISGGLGNQRIQVPDLAGLHIDQAERALLQAKLRLIILTDPNIPEAAVDTVQRQIPPPGVSVPEGSEIRVFARLSADSPTAL